MTSFMALDVVTSFLRLKDVTIICKRMRRSLSIGGSSSVGQLYEDKSLALRARDLIFFTTDLQALNYYSTIHCWSWSISDLFLKQSRSKSDFAECGVCSGNIGIYVTRKKSELYNLDQEMSQSQNNCLSPDCQYILVHFLRCSTLIWIIFYLCVRTANSDANWASV